MLNKQNLPEIEQEYDCRFVESNIHGVLYAVDKKGWAVITGNRAITGNWGSLPVLVEELQGPKEVYG